MKKEMKFSAQMESVGCAKTFIETTLSTVPLEQKKSLRYILAAEEMLIQMVEHADSEESIITVRIETGKRGAKITISCKGREWKLEKLDVLSRGLNLTQLEDDQASIISHMLLSSMSEKVKLRHSHGVNFGELSIEAGKSDRNNAVLKCMLIGIALGLLLKFALPDNVEDFLSVNVFSLCSTMFLNAIKMIVVPLVFFSIADSMTGFSDYKVFGKIGGKIIALYFLTTAIAIALAVGIFQLMKPGDPSQKDVVMAIAGNVETSGGNMLTIREMLLNIIPVNFAGAFHSGDMLQIIFLAVLVGIASGMLGGYSEPAQKFIRVANSLFSQIACIILKVLPLATLCFMANTVLTINLDSMTLLLHAFITQHIALLLMICVYCVMLAITRINPMVFLRKFKDAMLTAFTTASSSGSMPVVMKSLDDMGVSPKIYSFSIPLGATINMDGASIGYVVTLLFMMRIFGIPLDGSNLLSIFITVMMLSIGTPGIPGACIAMTAMLFTQYGIPAGTVGFVMPMILLSDYMHTMSNVTGDAVVTTIVAKSENMLDMQKMNK